MSDTLKLMVEHVVRHPFHFANTSCSRGSTVASPETDDDVSPPHILIFLSHRPWLRFIGPILRFMRQDKYFGVSKGGRSNTLYLAIAVYLLTFQPPPFLAQELETFQKYLWDRERPQRWRSDPCNTNTGNASDIVRIFLLHIAIAQGDCQLPKKNRNPRQRYNQLSMHMMKNMFSAALILLCVTGITSRISYIFFVVHVWLSKCTAKV